MDTKLELEALFREYQSYFPVCELRLTPSLGLSSDDIFQRISRKKYQGNHLFIETGEGKHVLISVSEAGWFQIGESVYCPTFEALLNTLSEDFRNKFATKLSAKLENLS